MGKRLLLQIFVKQIFGHEIPRELQKVGTKYLTPRKIPEIKTFGPRPSPDTSKKVLGFPRSCKTVTGNISS